MKLIRELLGLVEDHEDDNLYEMARIKPSDSGINVIMCASTKEGVSHGPRIKVSNVRGTFAKRDNFSVTISDNPEVIEGTPAFKTDEVNDILKFVKRNKRTLLNFWEDDYKSDAELYSNLRSFDAPEDPE